MKYLYQTQKLERGILTSSYKQQIRIGARDQKLRSLSRVKSLIKNRQEEIQSQTGTILRVSLFLVAIIAFTY